MSPRWIVLWPLLSCAGCGAANTGRQPPGKPPTPVTVTQSKPGGNAHDPHAAALTRLLEAPWGARNDRDDQIHAPTPDWKNWKRVRFWGVKHFTGFRYGDEHHVMALVFVQAANGAPTDAASCMRRFEATAHPQIKEYQVELGSPRTHGGRWHDKPLAVRSVDGFVDVAMEREFFSAAWAAYEAYPEACMVYSVAVPWRGQEQLARRLRDRWVREGFQRLRTLTETTPTRK